LLSLTTIAAAAPSQLAVTAASCPPGARRRAL